MNKLYYGDNLPILREYVEDASVDLIYLDPPFNSNRSYNVLFRDESGLDSDAQILAFGDSWHWGPSAEATWHDLVSGPDDVATLMNALRQLLGENQMMAYLVMMCARLVELRRVLKPTGSLYLHCDPTASHYLKVVLDTIFGNSSFRAEIVWRRHAHSHSLGAKQWPAIHDVLLMYSRSANWTWNTQHWDYSEEYIEKSFRHSDDGGAYQAYPITGARPGGAEAYQAWRGVLPSAGRAWALPGYGRLPSWLDLPSQQEWEALGIHAKLDLLDKLGMIHWPKKNGGKPSLKRYLKDAIGKIMEGLWTDIGISVGSREATGYPTQKPLALLERIIRASSNPDDVVLDPFCGCGTAVVAAQQLGRQWIGIDITHLSVAMMKARLHDECNGLRAGVDYEVLGEPTTLQDARRLALDDRYQFQFWALSLVNAQPLNNERKKGADRGIDGVLSFVDGSGRRQRRRRVPVQVKSGGVSSRDIRDLRGTVERVDGAIGVFITLEAPTGPMEREAVSAGFFEPESWTGRFPRLQILTIEALLDGAQVNMPLMRNTPRIAEDEMTQGGLPLPPKAEDNQ